MSEFGGFVKLNHGRNTVQRKYGLHRDQFTELVQLIGGKINYDVFHPKIQSLGNILDVMLSRSSAEIKAMS